MHHHKLHCDAPGTRGKVVLYGRTSEGTLDLKRASAVVCVAYKGYQEGEWWSRIDCHGSIMCALRYLSSC
jgi:hypothetical protein